MGDQTAILDYFRTDQVRAGAQKLLRLAVDGRLEHVTVNIDKLNDALQKVLEAVTQTYPDMQIPPYGVWRCFEAGGIDRWGALAGARSFASAGEMLASAADLAVLACFMTTRRPRAWTFEDPLTGTQASAEEASALAAFSMFASGAFSSDMTDPYRVDAQTLIRLERDELGAGLQWPADGNAGLIADMQRHLKRFGEALALRPDLFGEGDTTRPGLFVLRQAEKADGTVDALELLDGLLQALSPVWDGGAVEGDIALGDCFAHSALIETGQKHLQPFHLCAQHMVYSLLEPFAWAGFEVSGLQALTAPADLAHLALFAGSGVVDVKSASQTLSPTAAQDRMVELRAVALALTERIAQKLREELETTEDQLPLTLVLEAGTRHAGEQILRKDAERGKKLSGFLNPGSVFWLPFGA